MNKRNIITLLSVVEGAFLANRAQKRFNAMTTKHPEKKRNLTKEGRDRRTRRKSAKKARKRNRSKKK